MRLPENDWAFAGLELRTQSDYEKVYGNSNFSGKVHDSSLLYRWQWELVADACIDLSQSEADDSNHHLLITWLLNAAIVLEGESSERCYRVIASYLKDENPRIREWAALACTDERNPKRSIEWIVPLLDDSNRRVRLSAVSGLRILSAYSAAPLDALLDALIHEDEEVRLFASGALGSMAYFGHAADDIFDRLLDVHKNDPSLNVRVRALYDMANFESQHHRLVPFIRAAMQRSEVEYREAAVDALMNNDSFDIDICLEIVFAGVSDPSTSVREANCWLLQSLDVNLLVPHRERLETLAQSDDECIRDTADGFLSRIAYKMNK
ncbi:MAG: HEAT repeat domain-containing protein [Planctomycetota bacterium]|nr:HEAT repeat domain-containing protein [Planctomycetota bacterium]